jgi:F-type H+-transporting ATPase subunit a
MEVKRYKNDMFIQTINSFVFFLLFLAAVNFPVTTVAADLPPDVGEPIQKVDAGKIILDHVVDAYEWHIADYGHIHFTIPLPVILFYEGNWHFFMSGKFHHGKDAYKNFAIARQGPKKGKIIRVLDDGVTPDPNAFLLLDFSITKNAFSLFIASLLLCLILISVGKSYVHCGFKRAPRGLSAFLEPVILFVRDDIARASIPENKVDNYMPYLLTLFFFIFFNNLMGLVPFFPGGANVTGSISVTLTLALFTFGTVHLFANREYWKHIFNTPAVPFWLKYPLPLLPIIEIIGVIVKPVVLTLRLFANITAGHMIILGFVSLIFVLGAAHPLMGLVISPLSVMFVIFMNFLELLVAFIQAYVFTFFSAIFIGLSVPSEHHH